MSECAAWLLSIIATAIGALFLTFGVGNGRLSAWVVIDIVRMESGILAEHWDVIQDEATEADSKSGKPMFGNSFLPPTAK